jgi:hypothetical protein
MITGKLQEDSQVSSKKTNAGNNTNFKMQNVIMYVNYFIESLRGWCKYQVLTRHVWSGCVCVCVCVCVCHSVCVENREFKQSKQFVDRQQCFRNNAIKIDLTSDLV